MSSFTPNVVTFTSSGLTTASTAYAAGDQAGAEMTVPAIGAAGGYVLVTNIDMVDYSARIGSHELRLFGGSTTPASDNAAASWSDADALKRVCAPIICGSVIADTNNAFCSYAFQPFVALCDGSGNLYMDVVLRAVPTSNFFSSASDLHFTVGALQVS